MKTVINARGDLIEVEVNPEQRDWTARIRLTIKGDRRIELGEQEARMLSAVLKGAAEILERRQ